MEIMEIEGPFSYGMDENKDSIALTECYGLIYIIDHYTNYGTMCRYESPSRWAAWDESV